MVETHGKPRVWFRTSTGIGRSLAELVLEKGELVVATARQPSSLDDLAQKYPADRLLILPLDITQHEQVDDAFSRAKERFGQIDVVVNNAASVHRRGELESLSEEIGREIFEANFWGTLHVTKQAVKFFRDINPPGVGGRILQVSSGFGITGAPTLGYYSATKHAITGITEALVGEIDPGWNIKVTILVPGWTKTACLSKAPWSPPHPAYTNTSLPVSQARDGRMEQAIAWKDTRKTVEVFYKVALLSKPPLYFPIGQDAIAMMRDKIDEWKGVLDKYESWSDGLELDVE